MARWLAVQLLGGGGRSSEGGGRGAAGSRQRARVHNINKDNTSTHAITKL
jgi:hypothetical protein